MTKIAQFITFFIFLTSISYAQVDINPNSIGVNVYDSVSEVGINSVGNQETSLYVKADYPSTSSIAIRAEAYNVNNTSSSTYGVLATAESDVGNWSFGVYGKALRLSPAFNGRCTGVLGLAGDATPGANYGVFGRLHGSNSGAAIVGYDSVTSPGWNQVLPNSPNGISYAGYFWGKGYFMDNVGIGQEDPKEKLQVSNGNVYLDTIGNGVIMKDASGNCWQYTPDGSGGLTGVQITCPPQ